MSWTPYRGQFDHDWRRKKASTAYTRGALVDVVDGYIEVCVITRQSHSGIIQKTITSASTDYAATTMLPMIVPRRPTSEFKVSVLSTDTLAITDVGNLLDIGGSPVGIDVTNATSADDAVECVAFINANLGVFRLNAFKAQTPGIGTAT